MIPVLGNVAGTKSPLDELVEEAVVGVVARNVPVGEVDVVGGGGGGGVSPAGITPIPVMYS
jgi:hypothetical protein